MRFGNTTRLRWLPLIALFVGCLFSISCHQRTDAETWADLQAKKWYWKCLLAVLMLPLALLGILSLWVAAAQKDWGQFFYLLPLVLGCSYFSCQLVYVLAQGLASPLSIKVFKVLLHTSLVCALASVLSQLVLNLMRADSGYAAASGYEWRYLNKQGQLGARYSSATIKDVYEHRHGHGSWKRRQESQQSFIVFLRFLSVAGSVYAPFFLRSKELISTGELSTFVLVANGVFISTLVSMLVTVIAWGWIAGLAICVLLGGLSWWSGGLTAL